MLKLRLSYSDKLPQVDFWEKAADMKQNFGNLLKKLLLKGSTKMIAIFCVAKLGEIEVREIHRWNFRMVFTLYFR